MSSFVNIFFISNIEKKFRNQLKMTNALLDKTFLRLQIIYNNLLKSSKILKEIKTYFIRINNCHKMMQKICEKKKIQKIDRATRSSMSKQFVSFSSRSIYTFSFSVSSRRMIDYRKQKKIDHNTYFYYHELDHIATNYS